MFDISFSELLLIAVVALLVIGPEKLPKVARTVGAFTGRMQRYIAQVKDEVNREMRFDELQKLQQEIQSQASQLQTQAQSQVNDLKKDIEASLPENELNQASFEAFELTPPEKNSRKLSTFNRYPDRMVDTPLSVDSLAAEPNSEANIAKPPVKKASKRTANKKSTAQTP